MPPGPQSHRPIESDDRAVVARRTVASTPAIGLLALATLALAQALDLVTFIVMVGRHGPRAEANPLVGSLFDSLGMPAVVAVKLALVLLVAALFVAAWSRGRGGVWGLAGGLPIALAITAGLIGGITNAATILG